MLECLIQEMRDRALAGQNLDGCKTGFSTLYFGGGTPTVCSVTEIERLGQSACDLFLKNGVHEWTMEANPDDLDVAYLNDLHSIGVNRLSIGIQSFIDRDLAWMKRRHNAQDAIKAVLNAQESGFSNISIDLIYAIPGMSMTEWEANIQQTIDLNVQHISAYHLTLESHTIIGKQAQRGLFKPVDNDTGGEQYRLLVDMLQGAGFEQYEVSNFARQGYRSKHNSSYWQQQAYIGIGPSAHGYNGYNVRYNNIAHNLRYMEAIQNGMSYEQIEYLTPSDCYNEYLLTSLRTAWGIDIDKLNEPFKSYFLTKLSKYLDSGRIVQNDNIYRIPSEYFIVSDGIVCDLFWDGEENEK